MLSCPFEYDCTVPLSDPYEPQPGGCCSPWPYFIGDMVELPWTLTQDHTLFTLLRQRDIELWLDQVDRLRDAGGLIQPLTHPDPGYLGERPHARLYEAFLDRMAEHTDLWNALPRDVARWWRHRDRSEAWSPADYGTATVDRGGPHRVRGAAVTPAAEQRRPRRPRVTMLLENDLYPEDVRVRDEAHSLVAAGYDVRVIAPRGPGQARRAQIDDVTVERYWLPMAKGGGAAGLLAEYAVAHVQLLHPRPPLTAARCRLSPLAQPAGHVVPAGARRARPPPAIRVRRARPVPEPFRTALRAWSAVAYRRLLEPDDDSQRRHRPRDQRDCIWRMRGVAAREPRRRSCSSATARESRPCGDRLPEVRPGELTDPELLYVGALEPQDGVAQLPEILERLVVDHGLTGVRMTLRAGVANSRHPIRFRVTGSARPCSAAG